MMLVIFQRIVSGCKTKFSACRLAGTSMHLPNGHVQFGVGWGLEGAPIIACDAVKLSRFVQKRALECFPSINLYFDCRLLGGEVKTRSLVFKSNATNRVRVVDADLVIGADGATSTVRRLMSEQVRPIPSPDQWCRRCNYVDYYSGCFDPFTVSHVIHIDYFWVIWPIWAKTKTLFQTLSMHMMIASFAVFGGQMQRK